MTNYVSQLPGELNLEMVDDNDLTFSVDWHMDITSYTFTANIISKQCEEEIPMGIDIISATAGTMNVIISASAILNISPSKNRWYMNWETPSPESLSRTVLSGALVLRTK